MSCACQRIGFCSPSAVDTGSVEEHSVLDSVMDSPIYVDSGIMYMVDTSESKSVPISNLSENPVRKRYPAWTNEWMAQRLREDKIVTAVSLL